MSSRVSTNSYAAFDNRVGITLRVNGQNSRNAGSGGETWVVFFSETGVGAMLPPSLPYYIGLTVGFHQMTDAHGPSGFVQA